MQFSKIKLEILFLSSFIFYGCSLLQKPLEPLDLMTEIPIATVPLELPSLEGLNTGLFLFKNVDSQTYYISNSNGYEKTQLDLPLDILGVALSPNGQMVAYAPSGNPVLYLLDTKSKIVDILTDSIDLQPGIGLAWSPDSKNIVLSCRVQGTVGLSLCLVNIADKENIQVIVTSELLGALDIFDGAISPSWSKDGQKIVFLSSSAPPSSLGGKIVSTKDIWLFDFSTNTANLIFQDDTEGISHIFKPVFLSENNSILFSGREDSFNTIFDYKIDSQYIQNITFTDNGFNLVDFVLSPDEKSFLVHIPTPENSAESFVPTLFSIEGHLLEQLNSLANFQIISWSSQ